MLPALFFCARGICSVVRRKQRDHPETICKCHRTQKGGTHVSSNRPKIALVHSYVQTERIFASSVLERLRQIGNVVVNEKRSNPTPEEMRELIEGADICVTSWGCKPLTADILDAAPNLRLIVHAAGSIKPVVTPEVYRRGIPITSGAAVIAKGVAETALGFTLMSLKNIIQLAEVTRNGGWREPQSIAACREMCDVTVGVVGAGHVGREFLRLLSVFTEIDRLLFDPFITEEGAAALGAQKVELDELMRRSDVVSLHAPSIPATRHMIHAGNLRLMKQHATLINTARGSLINEPELVEVLREGRIKACLDVTDPEPPAPDHPLRKLPNVILTPHVAGAVTTGLFRLGRYTLQEVERFVAGLPAEHAVPEDRLEFIA